MPDTKFVFIINASFNPFNSENVDPKRQLQVSDCRFLRRREYRNFPHITAQDKPVYVFGATICAAWGLSFQRNKSSLLLEVDLTEVQLQIELFSLCATMILRFVGLVFQ